MQWTRPKSVRQIGGIPGRGRIYMEDYVMRFARQLAERGKNEEKAAVLLGNYYMYNGEKIYQISGIVEIDGFANRSTPELTTNIWDRLYSEIKENFTDLEIVGWFYSENGFSASQAPRLLEIHRANFRKGDKVLFIFDESEREDRFFIYRNGQLEQQKGYFIYYEKNPEMLHYMEKENNRHIHIVEQEDDRVVRNIRGIMREKEQHRARYERRNAHIGHGIIGMVALIAVLVGAVALKNQTTLNQMKEQLRTLQTFAQPQRISEGSRTSVETQSGGLQKEHTPEPSVTPASASGAAVQTSPAQTDSAQTSSAQADPAQTDPAQASPTQTTPAQTPLESTVAK